MAAENDVCGVLKARFNKFFLELVSAKNINSFYMTGEQYNEILKSVKTAKKAVTKSSLQYRRLKRFSVCSVSGQEKLIAPVSSSDNNLRFFVKNEEMFDILHDAHLTIGHGGKHRMLNHLNKKYKNVTQEVVKLYLKLCVQCQTKLKSKKVSAEKVQLFSEVNKQSQFHLIDMQSSPDGEYKFILVYYITQIKFVQIHALVSNTVEEVSRNLADIFCIFGPPSILQSNLDPNFLTSIIREVRYFWPGLEILYEKFENTDENLQRDVRNKIKKWMNEKNCKRWSEALRFVQLMQNEIYDEELKCSPYRAIFGCDIKSGISTSLLSMETTHVGLEAEEKPKLDLDQYENEHDVFKDPLHVDDEKSPRIVDENYSNCGWSNNSTQDLHDTEIDIKVRNIKTSANKLKLELSSPCHISKIEESVRVIEVDGNGLYKLGSQSGTIDELLIKNKLTKSNESTASAIKPSIQFVKVKTQRFGADN